MIGRRYVYRAADISLQWVENPNMEDGSGWYDQITSTNKPTWRFFHDGQMPMEDVYKLRVNGSGANPTVMASLVEHETAALFCIDHNLVDVPIQA